MFFLVHEITGCLLGAVSCGDGEVHSCGTRITKVRIQLLGGIGGSNLRIRHRQKNDHQTTSNAHYDLRTHHPFRDNPPDPKTHHVVSGDWKHLRFAELGETVFQRPSRFPICVERGHERFSEISGRLYLDVIEMTIGGNFNIHGDIFRQAWGVFGAKQF